MLRALLKSPGYALTCIAVLALGIGANAAIFSFLYAIVIRPLPYPDPGRLVFIWESFPTSRDPLFRRMRVPLKNFLIWKQQNTVFSSMAAFREMGLPETGVENAANISVAFATPELFPMLGVQPAIGRVFRGDEERVAMLSDRYFERRFHRDPGVLGKAVAMGGAVSTVIGVLPRDFHLPATSEGQDQIKPDIWVPLSRLKDNNDRALLVVGRLKPGVTLEHARAEMLATADHIEKGWRASVYTFSEEDTSPMLHRALYILFGAVGFLLLIACANLANLTLARGAMRVREIAVRLALGASRARIVRGLLAEALLVSLAGAAFGLIVARWCVQVLLALRPPDVIMRPELIGVSPPVFLFAFVVCVITTLLFGLAPALAVSGVDLQTALHSGGWGASAARVRSRQFLIAVEVAMATLLLAGAGLLLRSFQQVLATGIGFETEHLAMLDVDLPQQRYPTEAARTRFFRDLVDRARATPGVTAAAITDNLPLHSVSASNFYIAGRPEPPIDQLPISDHARVSPEYFQTLGLRLIAGRWFTPQDKDVAIVNQTFAHLFFPNENPLSQRLLGQDKKTAWQIVGVVSDYTPMGVENGSRPQYFRPDLSGGNGTLVVRTTHDPALILSALQQAVWSLDRSLPQSWAKPMRHYTDSWQAPRKYYTLLLAIFAGLALLLAIIGIYGVLSNLVASRVREIGIRMAIGARPGQIAKLVSWQGMAPVTIGVAAGIAGSVALGRYLESLLFHVRPRDPLSLAVACAAILITAPLAIFVPLRRAVGVDCTVALREE